MSINDFATQVGADMKTVSDRVDGLIWKGVLPDGTDIDTIRTPGIYTVSSTTSARTMPNWPTGRAGTLIAAKNDGATMISHDVIAYVSTTAAVERHSRASLSVSSWAPWSSADWVKGSANGTADARTQVDTFRSPGAWSISSRAYVDGLPGAGTGVIEVKTFTTTGLSQQEFFERTDQGLNYWARMSASTSGWAGIPWTLMNPSIPEPGGPSEASRVSDVQVSDHASRVEYARARRGGGIGTNGVPVFMWRFDHWLVAFRDKILPILREFDLPATLNVNLDNLTNSQNGGGTITWGHVQDWNQFDGIEIANHGSTHTNVSTAETIFHEIVEGRRGLEAAMPRVAVETWQEHGSAYLIASDIPGDTGLDLGRTPEAFFESYAGRLVMAEHAIVEGKTGSFYPPLTGYPQVGQSHYSMDRQTSAESIDTIKYAQQVGRGLTGYTHPGLMDGVNIGGSIYYATYHEDGSVDLDWNGGTHFATEQELRDWAATNGHIVHMPVKDFRSTCEWIAAERDAGRLMVMTAAGGGFADRSHDRRENLLVNPLFDGFDGWSSTSGWTVTGGGTQDVEVASGASTSRFTQGMLLFTRFGWAMGATHELLVHVKADVETTLMLRMEKMGDPLTWATSKDYVVPGDGVVRAYRLNLTLPRDRTFTSMTVYIGGPSMTIVGAPLLAAI